MESNRKDGREQGGVGFEPTMVRVQDMCFSSLRHRTAMTESFCKGRGSTLTVVPTGQVEPVRQKSTGPKAISNDPDQK